MNEKEKRPGRWPVQRTKDTCVSSLHLPVEWFNDIKLPLIPFGVDPLPDSGNDLYFKQKLRLCQSRNT
jgi:hypothetical protein